MGLTPIPDTSELALMTQPVEFMLSETIVAETALRCKQNPSKGANDGMIALYLNIGVSVPYHQLRKTV
jgi:hypothetical protein